MYIISICACIPFVHRYGSWNNYIINYIGICYKFNFVKEKATEWQYAKKKKIEIWYMMADLLTFFAPSEMREYLYLGTCTKITFS